MMRQVYAAIILLLLMVTLRGNFAGEITPVAVKMSSVWKLEHPKVQEFPGSLCIDDHFETKCHTGGTETWPWVAIEIPLSNVKDVIIINTNDFGWERTKNVKVWVGDSFPTTTDTEYSQGKLLGTFKGPGTKLQVIHIEKTKGLDGKFVIVQMTGTSFINLAEIHLFSGEIGPCGSHITRFVNGKMWSGVFNFEKMFCDSDNEKFQGGDDLGYWLTPNKFTGEAFVAELGLKTRIKGVKLRNTHNDAHRDRSTKEFRVSVKNTETDPWEVLLTEDLEDSRNQNPPPLQQFEGEKALWGTFIRFELLDYWGEGGGLHYFDIIPA